jgi:hypothetical protein
MTMTVVIIRWFSPLLICLVLTGCSLPLQNLSSTEETEYFAHGLDQYIASGDLTILKRLPQQYPQGEWRTKAEGLVGNAEQHQARLKEKEKELEQAQKEQATLVKKNQELEVTLEQLKQVLIDMELKTK